MRLELLLEDRAIGPFRVGENVDDVLQRFNDGEKFSRGDERFIALYDSDLQVSVDESGNIQFVEAFDPITVVLDGKPLTGKRLVDVEDRFRAWGLHRVMGSDGFICLAKSCVVASQGGKVSSVAVFRSGYYDGLPLEAV